LLNFEHFPKLLTIKIVVLRLWQKERFNI